MIVSSSNLKQINITAKRDPTPTKKPVKKHIKQLRQFKQSLPELITSTNWELTPYK